MDVKQRNRPVGTVRPILKVEPNSFKRPATPKKIKFKSLKKLNTNSKPPVPIFQAILAHMGILILTCVGAFRDFITRFFPDKHKLKESPDLKSFTPLYSSYEAFFTAYIYMRIRDCWNKAICSCPGRTVDMLDRTQEVPDWGWKFKYEGVLKERINMASYNYLGFAETKGACADAAVKSVEDFSFSSGSTVNEIGRYTKLNHLEKRMAEFLDVDDTIIFGMGFATNSMNIPALVDNRCLIISDQCNHSSIVLGCRLSGAVIKTFKHNDVESLEQVLRQSILEGNPRWNKRPWKKILIVVEGIYSMEGTICDLARIVELKRKYKAYLYTKISKK